MALKEELSRQQERRGEKGRQVERLRLTREQEGKRDRENASQFPTHPPIIMVCVYLLVHSLFTVLVGAGFGCRERSEGETSGSGGILVLILPPPVLHCAESCLLGETGGQYYYSLPFFIVTSQYHLQHYTLKVGMMRLDRHSHVSVCMYAVVFHAA